MSRFQQLRESRTEQRRALFDYYNDLRGTVGVITQGFEDYLELPVAAYIDDDSKEQRYVQLGKIENNSFKEARVHELKGEDTWLDFAILLTIDEQINAYPKQSLYTAIKVRKSADGYHVQIGDYEAVVPDSSELDFSAVYEEIFQRTMNFFSFRP